MNRENDATSHQAVEEEKRDFPRFKIECPASLQVEGDEQIFHAVVTDMSATGLGLSSTAAVAVGNMVVVAMTPDAQAVPPLRARARVMRCDGDAGSGYQLGLEFVQMLPGL